VKNIFCETHTRNTPTLTFTLTDDATGAAVDLTDATVTFTAMSYGGDSPEISEACDPAVDPTTGVCSLTLSEADTAASGRYECELLIEWATAEKRATSKLGDLLITRTLTPAAEPEGE